MKNRFVQYAGLLIGALLAWCRIGSAATGVGALDLRPAIRPGGLPADSCGHGSNLQRDEQGDDGVQPTTPAGDCELIVSSRHGFVVGVRRQIDTQANLTPEYILAMLERLDSGPPR